MMLLCLLLVVLGNESIHLPRGLGRVCNTHIHA
jgi:hypothetical protein